MSEVPFSFGYVKEHFKGTRTDKECRLIAYEMSTIMQLMIYRKDDLKKRLERSKRLYEGKEKIRLSSTGEEGVQLIKALCGLKDKVSNVNLPNYGLQIPILPKDAVVETNALFTFGSVAPVYAGKMPEDIRKLTLPHIKNHERIYQAVIQKDRRLVYEAFENDPLIHKRLNGEQIRELVDQMIDRTSKYTDI